MKSTTNTEKENTLSGSTCSTLDSANNLICQQEYLLERQNIILNRIIKQNGELISKNNKYQRENHKIRKELNGYKNGRIWTVISSILPTLEIKFRDE